MKGFTSITTLLLAMCCVASRGTAQDECSQTELLGIASYKESFSSQVYVASLLSSKVLKDGGCILQVKPLHGEAEIIPSNVIFDEKAENFEGGIFPAPTPCEFTDITALHGEILNGFVLWRDTADSPHGAAIVIAQVSGKFKAIHHGDSSD